jgi:hypothetical protein
MVFVDIYSSSSSSLPARLCLSAGHDEVISARLTRSGNFLPEACDRQKPEAATKLVPLAEEAFFSIAGLTRPAFRFLPPLLQCLLCPIRRALSTLLILRHEVVLVHPRFKLQSPL